MKAVGIILAGGSSNKMKELTIKRAAAAMRLQQNVAPHSARKVYAVELLAKYGDIDRVRRALNHSSAAVTIIYALADKQLQSKSRRRRAAPGRKKV